MTIDSIDIVPSARVGDRRRAEREAVCELLRRNGLGPLTHDEQGAPHLDGMFISVSHSREKAVIAFSSDSPLGVDTEPTSPRISRIIERVLTERERQMPLDPHMRWMAKEAVFKAAAIDDLTIAEITVSPDGMAEARGRNFIWRIAAPDIVVAFPVRSY